MSIVRIFFTFWNSYSASIQGFIHYSVHPPFFKFAQVRARTLGLLTEFSPSENLPCKGSVWYFLMIQLQSSDLAFLPCLPLVF